MRDTRNTTTVQTQISVKKALELAPAGTLSPEQERVLRMRTGASLDLGSSLDLQGQAHPETRAKLAMMEALAMEALACPKASKPAVKAENATKALIIARLKA